MVAVVGQGRAEAAAGGGAEQLDPAPRQALVKIDPHPVLRGTPGGGEQGSRGGVVERGRAEARIDIGGGARVGERVSPLRLRLRCYRRQQVVAREGADRADVETLARRVIVPGDADDNPAIAYGDAGAEAVGG